MTGVLSFFISKLGISHYGFCFSSLLIGGGLFLNYFWLDPLDSMMIWLWLLFLDPIEPVGLLACAIRLSLRIWFES